MGELKQHQLPMTIDEQIENLKSLGLIIENDKHWNLYVDQIELLIDKYEKVDVKTMGFPDDWKKLLEQK